MGVATTSRPSVDERLCHIGINCHRPLHSCLVNKTAGLITWWVLKDCTSMPLYWLSHLTVFFVPGNICMQLLWIFPMQAYPQGHHDLMFLSSQMVSTSALTFTRLIKIERDYSSN
jgi:hypothetical protein